MEEKRRKLEKQREKKQKMEEKAKKKKITPIVFSDKENGNTLSLSDLCLTLPQHSFLLSLNYMYVCMYDKNLFLILSKVYSIQHYVIKFVNDLWQISGFLWETNRRVTLQQGW